MQAQATPMTMPTPICVKSMVGTEVSLLPEIMASATMVSMYAMGSLLPLSISKRGAVECFRLRFLERRIENTEAASVELKTAPIRKLSENEKFRS